MHSGDNPGGSDTLDEWSQSPKVPIAASEDPVVKKLIQAAGASATVDIIYSDGAGARNRRSIKPMLVFETEGYPGRYYVRAFCHLRQAERNFRADRIRFTDNIKAVGVGDRPARPQTKGCALTLAFLVLGPLVLLYLA